ncbi:MAG: penicillin-binding protein [Bacteroidetes bacterium CG23_combo_of_CG06-09_8_20_14_all_32_9]|nr:MAG: penicillin-binding protein [Bacteroidetes bacterium CG23_combo_of_CG06-09_8_20_14_all_32_9]
MNNKPADNIGTKRFKLYIKFLWFIFIFPIISVFILFFFISEGYLGYMPSFSEMENPKNNIASEVISSDGIILGTYFKENRTNAKFENISPYLVKALIATEDVRFYSHSGVDIKALGRVVLGTGRKGGGSTISQQLAKMLFPREDFSNFFSKILRKLREWVMAVKLEKRYTKEEIIIMYFNKFDFLNLAVGIKSAAKVYFNSEPDSLKLEQAAMLVGMAKNPSLYNPLRRPDLTKERRNIVLSQMKKYGFITEAQFDSLKLLPLNVKFQRVDHKEGIATYFREYIRIIMDANKPEAGDYIDKQEYYEDSLDWETNPLYGWCNKNLKPNGTPYNIYKDGIKIYSTVNSAMQKYAEYAVARHLKDEIQVKFFKEQKGRSKAPYAWNVNLQQIDEMMIQSMKRSERYRVLKLQGLSSAEIEKTFHEPAQMSVFSWKGDIDTVLTPWDSIKYYKFYLRASLMSMEPQTGFVRAYVGGINYRHFQYDMVELGRRQVGSTFKPFLYTLAMQEGYSPCYEVPNVPVTFELPDGNTWTPHNSGKTKRDGKMITLRWALANSVNFISAWLMKRYNPYAVINIARKMGVRSKIEPVPAICLGTPELKLAEMVGAFSTFADHGIYTQPIFVTRITDKNGNVLATFKPARTEAISEETSYLMIELLRGVVSFGTSWRVKGVYKAEGDIAAKTGTTQNQSDGWYVGLVPRLVTGVWVGGEDRGIHFNSIVNGQGASMALPIWAYYMEKIYANKSLGYSVKEMFEKPKNIKINIDCSKEAKYEELPGNDYDIIEGVDL